MASHLTDAIYLKIPFAQKIVKKRFSSTKLLFFCSFCLFFFFPFFFAKMFNHKSSLMKIKHKIRFSELSKKKITLKTATTFLIYFLKDQILQNPSFSESLQVVTIVQGQRKSNFWTENVGQDLPKSCRAQIQYHFNRQM